MLNFILNLPELILLDCCRDNFASLYRLKGKIVFAESFHVSHFSIELIKMSFFIKNQIFKYFL